ncbi:tetratricopeptide repeat protein [Rubellimicrobium rubrum]|nr:tetratricopeptide repeat protein [Rubellimicrobium rubrum]
MIGSDDMQIEMDVQRELVANPRNAAAHQQLSELHHRQGRMTKAVASARRAVELQPDLVEGWLHLGSLLLDGTNALGEAEDALRHAIELWPDGAIIHLRLGRLLLRRGHAHDAIRSIRHAALLAPPEGWLWSEIGMGLADGNLLDEAKAALVKAIRLEPVEPLHQFRLGEVLQRIGDEASALAHIRRAAELGPEIAWLQSHLGHVLTEAGDLVGAQVALDRAEALAPGDGLTRSRKASLTERRSLATRRAKRFETATRSGRTAPLAACIVLAAPRTGSTVLGQSVSAAWQTDFFGEVFHDEPEQDTYGGNFFGFRRTLIAAEPSLSVPTLDNQRRLFQRYCEHIQSVSPSGASILDLKYYSWHHLNTCFVLPHEPPTLIDFVREASWPVVHLVRENLFALYCSLKLSQKSGVWHREGGSPSEEGRQRLRIDIDACRLEMDRLQSATAIFNDWFSGYDNYHHLTYERLFTGGAFSSEVEETFTKVLDEPPTRPLLPTTRKVTPPLHGVIENIEDVLREFKGTAYDAMVLEALS